MSAASNATREEKARRDQETLARDFLSLFTTSEAKRLIAYLGDLDVYEIRALRMDLDVTESTAKAGVLLRRLPIPLGGPPLSQGGTLFLAAHAGRSALKDPEIEKSELADVLKSVYAAMTKAKNPTWIEEDSVWTKIKGKLGSAITWDGVADVAGSLVEMVAGELLGGGSASGVLHQVISVVTGGGSKPAALPASPGSSGALPGAAAAPQLTQGDGSTDLVVDEP